MGVYRHKNGNWYCRGRINGERYHQPCAGANTQAEAKAVEDGIRYKIRQKQLGLEERKKNKLTVKFMLDNYVEICRVNNKFTQKSVTFRKYLLKYFKPNQDITTIKPSDIDKFKLYSLSLGRTKATTNRYVAALKRAYNLLIKDDLINYNPCSKVAMLPEDNKRYRVLSKEEWNRLYNVLESPLKEIVVFALNTGLRKQNILQCKWEQVNFDLGFIEVLKQDNKGKKEIKIPLTKTLAAMLQKMDRVSEYIFINPKTGVPFKNCRKSFDTALKKAGIEDFHFHDLRRTVGTWLLTNGVDLRTIQNILAHSDISTTERYLAITPEQNQRAMNVLDNYM